MKPKTILISTQELDPHADLIIKRLKAIGHRAVRLHQEDIPTKSGFSVSILKDHYSGFLWTPKHRVPIEDIRAAWVRRPRESKLPDGLDPVERAFARGELLHAISGFWENLDCYWMSKPDRLRAAGRKPEQLRRAASMGFEIPNTIITMDESVVQKFYQECGGKMIYKVLSSPMLAQSYTKQRYGQVSPEELPNRRVVYTTIIGDTELEANLASIKNAPCQFQEYIEKRCEYRVTLIGDDFFVAEIDSQSQARTSIDWRHYDVPMKIRSGSLPDHVLRSCYRFIKSYGLNYSAMDLILTPDGRYVFLENNPNGQWAWIEDRVPEMKMQDAMINALLNGKREASLVPGANCA